MPNVVEIVVTDVYRPGAGFQKAKEGAKEVGDAIRKSGDATEEVERKVSSMGSKLASTGKAVGAAAGVAAGGALAVGFASSLEFDTAQHKMEAQLGSSSQRAGELGQVAAHLYSNAWGSSMGEVDSAIVNVVKSGALMADATTGQIESITAQALGLAQTFDVDVAESMRAVGQLVRTKMVPDAQAGMDLVTAAFRELGPQAGDVLETITEYSVQFQKLGIDGQTALGLVNQMVKAGARDTDVAADALKEFAVRAVDGSKLTADSFKTIGLNADTMAARFAAGGDTAKIAFQEVIDKLKGIEDPVARNAVAVGLFGTQAEDLGAALFSMDTSNAVQGLGEVAGAAQKMTDAVGGDAQSKITGMKRTMETWLASMVNAPGVLGSASATIAAFGSSVLDIGSQMAIMAVAMPDKFKAMALSAVTSFGTMVGAAIKYVATSIGGAIASAAAWVAANIAMIAATGGILLAIAAVIAIVVLLVKHWDWVKAKASEVWEWIQSAWNGIKNTVVGAVQSVLDWVGTNWPTILAILGGPIGLAVKFIVDHWGQIKSIFMNGVNAVIGFVGWLGRLPGMVWSYLSSMASAVGSKINEIVNWFQGLGNRTIAAIGNLGARMAEVGRGIVTGIWNGIQSGWGWLQNQVANLARSLLATAKRALGIGSPSKAFSLQVGEEVPAGVAQGVERAVGVALRSVRSMGEQLLGAVTQDFSRGVGAGMPTLSLPTAMRLGPTSSPAPTLVTLRIDSSGERVDDLLVQLLQKYIRVQGGDVQVVLGR